MKCYVQALFTTAITAMVFMAKNSTLSTVTAVVVVHAVIIADEWRGWWGRWWSRRRRRGSIQVEGGEGGHLRPPQRHNPTPSRGRGWRQEVAEWDTGRWWRRRIYLSQSSLAGSCPLVAAGSRSCATVAAASTTSCLVSRSWWRGYRSWSSWAWYGRHNLKLGLGQAHGGGDREGGLASRLLNLVEDLQQSSQLVPHFVADFWTKWSKDRSTIWMSSHYGHNIQFSLCDFHQALNVAKTQKFIHKFWSQSLQYLLVAII